jgi:hypothetical protein
MLRKEKPVAVPISPRKPEKPRRGRFVGCSKCKLAFHAGEVVLKDSGAAQNKFSMGRGCIKTMDKF